ncbi:MAG: tetratricopeptide repeat protein [Bacteroidia bacterium]
MPADSNKAKSYYEISKLVLANRDFEAAHKYIDSGLVISKQQVFIIGIGFGYAYHGTAFRKSNNQDSAIKYYLKSLPFFKEDKNREALILESMAASYDACSKYDSALNYFHLAFQRAVINQDTAQQVRIITNIGAIYFYQSKYKEACENYIKALQIGEAMKDSEVIAANYINVANMMGLLGDSKNAIDYYLKAIPICESRADYIKIGNAYDNLAEEYSKAKKFEDAFKFSSKALTYYLKSHAKAETALCYKNLSDFYIESGDSLSDSGNKPGAFSNFYVADSLLNEGYKYAVESEDNYSLAIILINKGDVSDRLGNKIKAIKNYEDAILLCKETGSIKELAGVYKNLAALYEKTNNSAKAYHFLSLSMILMDSITKRENAVIIAELNTKYESEKKEQQIKILGKENETKSLEQQKEKQKKNFAIAGIVALLILGTYIFNLYTKRKKLSNQLAQSLTDLKQAQAQLIHTEKEKEAENIRLRISRDIHDDIGSNLTKIALLSDMTASVADKNSPEAKNNLEQISDYSRTINSSLSEIVWAISPKHDTLESLIIYMRSHIHKFFEGAGITYKINFPEHFENCQLNPDLKRNIFLVLKESLNNILKYAGAKFVTIDFKIDGDNFELKIKDDGVGFSPLSLGEGSGVRSGNGLNNMSYRMQQTGGSFKITSSIGEGSEVIASGNYKQIASPHTSE